ncbi:hypothetical protein [Streptomyces sp. Ag109_O5-1]|uniref:hypothetical protein n=1 Tax=Streptomyces sp. Ag109_O5-1 TaxID=1938851 RepID=UPI000F4D49B8|nr:hypothetical protein [Streptomyces sp. Ag109_O5-1]
MVSQREVPAGHVQNVGENLVLPDVDRRAVRGLKFSAALPERLAVATVAARLADFEGACSVLGEPTLQYDS